MSYITENDNLYTADTYARFPIEIVSGKGSTVVDSDGKKYTDLGSGIGVTAFGIADGEWNEAVKNQLDKIQHTSNLYYTQPCSSLAKMMCEKTGMKKVFFSNSGAEANECAIKTARKYSEDKKGKDYYTIITLKNSFHGRTITTLAATGQDKFHENFTPLTEGFVYCTANDCEELKKLVSEVKPAGIMLEIIQGEGGVVAVSEEFARCAQEEADKNDIPLIIDEVQTGNGRTGRLYAYMNYSLKPDIVSTAKGLGGGLPIGATMMSEKVKDVLKPGDHGSTFGGNPVCCAGALSILSRIDDKLLSEVMKKSDYIFSELSAADGVESVSGMGLMIGIKTKKSAKDVVNECMKNGVLCLTAKDKIRLLPALNIPFEQLRQAVEVIKKCL